ncbi:MAG: glycosyltransferase family 2 protein [Weeksellaceae bacterium]|nr:glycosyltransferase family 2 protein [Weeksellaceae bacterium]
MNDKENNIDISIVTVGMNHIDYLKPLLKSLFVDYPSKFSVEMIYVDNCSKDDSVKFLEENYPQVKIIKNSIPLGFGENNNRGALSAQGKYIAIINPDITFLQNSLDNLYIYSETLNKNVILAPKLLNPDFTLQHSVRGFITPWVFIMRLLTKGNDKTDNKIVQNYLCKNIDADKIQLIDWAIGAALFLKLDHYKDMQGFDSSYFLYVEDVDLCLRSWKNGNPVLFYPKSELVHNHLRSSTKLNKRTLMHIKSLFTYFRKHGIFVKSLKNNFPFTL